MKSTEPPGYFNRQRVSKAIDKVAALMVEENYHTLPVVDGGRLVGVVGKEDILRTLLPGVEK